MSTLRNMGLLYMRNLRQAPRIPVVLVFGIVMPVIQLLLFGSLFQNVTELPAFTTSYPDVHYRAYIAPAIILLTTFLGMANASAALLVDLRTGYFDKLRTTPARPHQVIVARLLAEMTRVTLQALLILFISLALGATVKTGVLGAIVMVLLCVFFSACTVGLLVTALAMKTKSDQATQSSFPLFFILIFLSTAYQAKEALPDWLARVVKYNPVDYLIRAVRELMIGANEGGHMVASWPMGQILIAVAASTVAAALLALLNLRIYRRMVG
ncbi:MAG TPA: ABC transporter permease [Candidatus Thermoplasmatota archaeon]|nr:ABC transporter permease [Candidatus Thermoplasmatota archaeon]